MFLFDMDLERKANETRRSKLLLTQQIYKQFLNQQIKWTKERKLLSLTLRIVLFFQWLALQMALTITINIVITTL